MPHSTSEVSIAEVKNVDKVFENLMRSLEPKLKGNDRENIRKAYDLSLDAHKFQRRKSGEPYILHPLEVARICHEEIGLGPTAIICAILHDVVEDTPMNLESIYEVFGPKVTRIVDGLTKLDGLYDRGSENAENLKKVLSTLVDDVRVVLIKMADRVHNLRTIGPMPAHKQLKIAAETMYIYAPLAHRLGLYKIKTEFEDICMQITDPDKYAELSVKVEASEASRDAYIAEFLKPMKPSLAELKIKYRFLARVKAISSIWNKIKNKNIDFDEIYDLFAVRIIVDVPAKKEKTVCWQIYSLITDHYKPIPERLKDWVTTPKGNGYESLHTTVIGPGGRFVEVQIRSERMDDIAERGFAAHWKYKGVKGGENVYDKWLANIRDLLEDPTEDAIDFLNDFKTNLFNEEVYVFTPKGDMRILPQGATALDFAFDIHSDVGAQAISIKVNNKLVPMGYQLNNGDQIHITTSKNQSPKEDWLKLVITGKARSKIRSTLNDHKKKLAELGKESLQRKLRNIKAEYDLNIDTLANHYSCKTRQEFYVKIADDIIKLADITKHFQVDNGILKPIDKVIIRKQEEDKKKLSIPKSTAASLIVINDQSADSFQYELSNCCNPVPGEDIFAFMTASSGMKIHRLNCKNAANLFTNYGYRILKAEWAELRERDFVVELRITGVDSGPGVIQLLTNELSNKLNVNIRSFNIEGDEGVYNGSVKIVVKDKVQLNHIINSLKSVESIATVERISS